MRWKGLFLLIPAAALAVFVFQPGREAGATKGHFKNFKKKYPKLPSSLAKCDTCHVKKGRTLKPMKVWPDWMYDYKGDENGVIPDPKPVTTTRSSRYSSRYSSRRRTGPSKSASKKEEDKKKADRKLPEVLVKLMKEDAKTKRNGKEHKPHNLFGLTLICVGGKKKPINIRMLRAKLLDSDGDGFNNEQELRTGHHPGDPNDKPTAAEVRKAKVGTGGKSRGSKLWPF